jgi:O-antigen ligase
MEQDLPKAHSRRRFTLRKIFIGLTSAFCLALVARQIIGSNTTGTGRLENNRNTISAIRSNLLLGQGPSIFSINSTENTILTLLSFYGLIGLAFMLAIALAFTSIFRKIPRNERHSFLFALAIFLVASTGETLLTGASQDTGLFYLLVLLTLTRGEPSSKALP